FIRGGIVAATTAGTVLAYRKLNGVDLQAVAGAPIPGIVKPTAPGYVVQGEEPTPLESIANYNNFYEFTTNKDGVAGAAADFKTAGWKIEVGGLCAKPRVFDMDMIRKLAPPEERIYRMRCVEAWSMVIPWVGFSLSKLLNAVEPTSAAKYVAMETLYDPKRFPNQSSTSVLEWPYVEGLRIDEAM